MQSFTRTLLITLSFLSAAHANEASHQIDALLAKDWQQHKLTANPPANDETLVAASTSTSSAASRPFWNHRLF